MLFTPQWHASVGTELLLICHSWITLYEVSSAQYTLKTLEVAHIRIARNWRAERQNGFKAQRNRAGS